MKNRANNRKSTIQEAAILFPGFVGPATVEKEGVSVRALLYLRAGKVTAEQ